LLINESGLYTLVLKSRKPEAKPFKKWITKEVIPSIRKTGGYGKRKSSFVFLKRYHANSDRLDSGYFSVISELFVRVYGKLELKGHIIPDKSPNGKEIRPDVSVGKTFPKWLENHKHSMHYVGKRKRYTHLLPDGTEVEAWQYDNLVLPVFIQFIEEEWLPNRAFAYFKERDQKALDYLPKIISPPKEPATNEIRT